MSSPDWLRTFVAIYRSGSVSAGAALRGTSQPAASQQLAALERRVGLPRFTRTTAGVEPTRRGRELLAEVGDSLDRLEPVFAGVDGGSLTAPSRPVRFGSSAEFFAHSLQALFDPGGELPGLTAFFGPDDQLVRQVGEGELDLAVTSTAAGRRGLATTPIGSKRFVLVAPPGLAPDRDPGSGVEIGTLDELGRWLVGKPWVAYSAELPRTRRFWLTSLDRAFAGDLRLVVPDLRVVAEAVARGVGVSLLPEFVCTDALAQGSIVELFPVADVVPAEPWFASTRVADAGHRGLGRIIEHLARSVGP